MIRTSVESQFEFEVKYNLESDPPHQEFVETLSALTTDYGAPLHDRGVAIELLKRRP